MVSEVNRYMEEQESEREGDERWCLCEVPLKAALALSFSDLQMEAAFPNLVNGCYYGTYSVLNLDSR